MSGDTSSAGVHGPPGASGTGPTRTDVHCHNCSHTFVALVDYSIDGNHVVECPYCAHEHFRTIKAGVITGDRWAGGLTTTRIPPADTWKLPNAVADQKTGDRIHSGHTNTAAAFIRELWLQTGGEGAL